MSRFIRKISVIQAIYTYIALFIFINNLSFLEESESVLSAFIAHEYSPLSKDYALLDTSFLILPLISWINGFFKGVQLYGYFVFIATFSTGILFLNILQKAGAKLKKDFLLIGLAFVIFQIPNLISLSITRVTFILAIAFLLSYHFNLYSRLKLGTIYLLCIIFRIDLIVLLSIVYLFVDIITAKKIRLKSLSLIAFAISIFTVYNLFISNYASEPFKTFYYNELDFTDRDNINYDKLNEIQLLIVQMGKQGVIDELLFEQSFVNSILYSKNSFLTNVVFAPELFLNVFKHSLDTLYKSAWLIFFCIFLILFQIRKSTPRRIFLLLFLFLFPSLICFYISLPNRFVFPYYSILTLFLILNHSRKYHAVYIVFIITVINIQYSLGTYSTYKSISMQFINTMHKTKMLEKTYGAPLIFENAFYSNLAFINPNINYRYTGNNYLFLNTAFFQAFNNYQESWQRYKCINPLSIKEKIITAQRLGKPILFASKDRYESYKYFLKKRYSFNENFDYIILK